MAKSLSSQLKKLKVQQEVQLKEQAEKNTTVQKGSSANGYENLKKGVPLDHETKQKSCKNKDNPLAGKSFGISLGCTLNMENYESMRIDCWLTDTVREGETIEEAFTRVQAILEEQLEEMSSQYK